MRYGNIPEAVKKSLTAALMDNNPNFHRLMAEMQEQVYTEFEISDREGFEKAADELANTDNEIKLIMQEIRDNVSRACNGVKLPMTIPLPDHVTAETTLNVYKSMVYSILMRLNEFLEEYVKEHGVINTFEEEFNRKLGSVLEPAKVKKEFMKLHRYDCSDIYHENYVYASAIKQFSKEDDKYAKVIQRIDFLNNNLLKMHLTPGQNFGKLKEKIEEIMVVGIELTQPIIDVAPNAQAILDQKAKENQETAEDTGKKDEVKVVDDKKETQENEKPQESVTSEEPVPKTPEVPEPTENTEESENKTTDDVIPVKTDEPAPENTDEPVPETTDEPTPETTDEPARETTDETVPETTDEPARETTDEPVSETTDVPKEPVPETTDDSEENVQETTNDDQNETDETNQPEETGENVSKKEDAKVENVSEDNN